MEEAEWQICLLQTLTRAIDPEEAWPNSHADVALQPPASDVLALLCIPYLCCMGKGYKLDTIVESQHHHQPAFLFAWVMSDSRLDHKL